LFSVIIKGNLPQFIIKKMYLSANINTKYIVCSEQLIENALRQILNVSCANIYHMKEKKERNCTFFCEQTAMDSFIVIETELLRNSITIETNFAVAIKLRNSIQIIKLCRGVTYLLILCALV